MADTAGQWHALIGCSGQHRRPVARSNWLLWPTPQALIACKRLHEPSLFQEGAIISWNIGIKLLTPQWRKHVHRVFLLCAQTLELYDSPLVQLRARLHFEIAKCEVASDFLAKAITQVDKSLGNDYGDLAEHEQQVNKASGTL